MLARLGNALLALSLVFVFSAGTATSTKATGATGPIQIGGDDQNGHGNSEWFDHDSDPATPNVVRNVLGWKYVTLSLKGMLATEQRAGASNSIAVIGTDDSDAYATSIGVTPNDGGASCTNFNGYGDTYCMMEVVEAELDRLNGADAAPTVTYYETAAEVTAFFNALTAGTTNVAVVFIPGDDGQNDLGWGATGDTMDYDSLVTTPMEQALIDSAADIATFNVQGGGLLSSGVRHYASWLSVLIPTISATTDETSDYIGMTADGTALWTGLTDRDISSIWHNHFTGDLGALQVLAVGYKGISYIDSNGNGYQDYDEFSWNDLDSDNMIDAGENLSPHNWRGLDGLSDTADDLQTIVVIGGAAGEAALGEELPPTNTSGDASASWALLVAALAAVAGLALRVAERKRLQA